MVKPKTYCRLFNFVNRILIRITSYKRFMATVKVDCVCAYLLRGTDRQTDTQTKKDSKRMMV